MQNLDMRREFDVKSSAVSYKKMYELFNAASRCLDYSDAIVHGLNQISPWYQDWVESLLTHMFV